MKTAILTGFLMLLSPVAFAMNDCQTESLHILKKNAPQSFSAYSYAIDQNLFLQMLTCRQPMILELSHAVKSAVHSMPGFRLLNGATFTSLALAPNTIRPDVLINQVDMNNSLINFYLAGDSQVKGDANFLFAALNAHAYELQTAIQLHALLPGSGRIALRERLVNVMNMVKLYIEQARKTNSTTFTILMDANRASTIRKLWEQAETVLNASCAPNKMGLGVSDLAPLEQLYSTNNSQGLVMLLNYTPEISSQCRNAAR